MTTTRGSAGRTGAGWESGGRVGPPRWTFAVGIAVAVVVVGVLARSPAPPPTDVLDIERDERGEPDVVDVDRDERAEPDAPPGDPAEPDPGARAPSLDPGAAWHPLPPAPLTSRVPLPGVWADDRLVVWSGAEVDAGAAYVPAEDRWIALPPAPIGRGSGWSAVWTGTEILYWGGLEGGQAAPPDGAALDPAAGTWRTLPAAPLVGRGRAATAWDGARLYVWGGQGPLGQRDRYLADGAVLDLAAGEWEPLPEAPLGPRAGAFAAWTGTRLLVWGGADASAPFLDGALYDPAAEAWEPLPPLPIAFSLEPAVVWTGAELLVWGLPAEGLHQPIGWALDPAGGQWRGLPDLLAQERAAATGTWDDDGGRAIVWGGLDRRLRAARLDGFRYEPLGGGWRQLPAAPLSARLEPTVVWTGDALLVWGGAWRNRPVFDGARYRP